MPMSTIYNFPKLDLSDGDYFDPEDRAVWDEINKSIVYDFETVEEDMTVYGYYNITDEEIDAFSDGAKYAFKKVNEALKIAGINAQVCYLDLVDGTGYILTQIDEAPQDFVNRVLGNVAV